MVGVEAKRYEAATHRGGVGHADRGGDRSGVKPPVGDTIVARASSKASIGFASGLAWFAIGSFARIGGGAGFVVGVAFAAGSVAFIWRALRRPVEFSASVDGFTLGSGQRFVPWSEVEEIRVAYRQGWLNEAHSLRLELRRDPSVATPFISTNRTNPKAIDLSLDGLSSPWQDIVVDVAAVSARPVVREPAFGVSGRSFRTE